MAEFFTALFGAPIPNVLIVMALFLLTFSVLFKIEGGPKSPKIIARENVYQPGLVLGLLLIGMWLFYPFITKFQSTATETPTPAPIVNSTSAAPAIPLQPATETPIAAAPATSTTAPSPMPVLTLNKGCIFASTWRAATFGAITLSNNPDSNGCLSLDMAGIVVDKFGILQLRQTAKTGPLVAGIYTPIGDKSVIEFNVLIKSFYIINTGTPATINFSVAPATVPLNSLNSARFKLSVDTTVKSPYIYFVLADLGETNGNKVPTQHYEYQYTYAIRIELTGAIIHVYINGNQMTKELSMPPGPKVFFVGYNLPPLANADVQISDIRVDGVEK